MSMNIILAYIPLTFAILILIYSSVYETSMPYKAQVLLAMAGIMLLVLSMLILFGV